MNRRNADYVLEHNPRALYPRVDNKVLTKRICESCGIPVPETIAVIERHGDIRRLASLVASRQEFVVKPGSGSEGRGIIVVVGHSDDEFTTAGGQTLGIAEMCYHLSSTLSGLYSLGGQPDCAILEQRIIKHPVFESVAVGGTPDIRVILYRGLPAMAMVRLPTRQSRGRANLHQGAVAAGIDLRSGRTFGGVCQGQEISTHPDTGASIEGLEVPQWLRLLTAAMQVADALELGYLGVDFVLDVRDGPVILEANARPGLAIQIANRRGLRPRLQWIDRRQPEKLSLDARRELIASLAAIG